MLEEGNKKISWALKHMPLLRQLQFQTTQEKPFRDYKIGMCLHLEAKTAALAHVLSKAGAEVAICGSNPMSTKDDIVQSLIQCGMRVFSHSNMNENEYYENISRVVEFAPHLIVDDGADLVSMMHQKGDKQLGKLLGGTEETTTGITRLKKMHSQGCLAIPIIAVNDTPMKYLFDNRYGTAQSTLTAFLNTTNMSLSGKTLVVCGYGWCGKGIASRAKGLGASVIICEIDFVKANEAVMDGFRVMKMSEAALLGDIFITVTGCKKVITGKHFPLMRTGAILMNSGHFDHEIWLPDLEAQCRKKYQERTNITTYKFDNGKELYLLTEGRLVNLVAGDGHPLEIIDLSFSLQLLSLKYLLQNAHQLAAGIISVPQEIDQMVAQMNLENRGLSIDVLTEEQAEYLSLGDF